jgi:thioredoxin 1
MVKVLTDSNFSEEVLQSKTLSVVSFGAERCDPCKNVDSAFEELSIKYDGQLSFAKIDVDNDWGWAKFFGITAIPCIMLIRDFEVVNSSLAVTTKEGIEELVAAHYSLAEVGV